MKIGIIGLPNVGKSTLFAAMTKKKVACKNYPFCTIDPNVGMVEVPDERLKKLADISSSEKIIPTVIEFVDVAGLVRGAHKGEGLGNKFLTYIKEVDALLQIVRAFDNDDIHHVEGDINPKRDIETINLELIMSDLVLIDKRIDMLKGKARTGDKEAQTMLNALEKIKVALDAGKPARGASLGDKDLELLKSLNLLTLKPVLYVFNIAQQKDGTGVKSIPPELSYSSLTLDVRAADTNLNKLIQASYKLVNLITFFTSGEMESRAWTVTKGSRAPHAAGKIHTDMETGFIRMEVVSYNDFIKFGGWNGARQAGVLRVEGKEYEIIDGDICFVRFAV